MPLRVDVATGATVLHDEDLCLPGFLPLVLARTYRSDRRDAGLFGEGWRSSLDVSLEVRRDRLVFHGVLEQEVSFAPIAMGVQATHHETGLVLQHHPDAFVAFFSPLVQQIFPKQHPASTRLRLARIEDRNGNKIQLLYSGPRLVRLVDSMGRQVHLTYGGDRVTALHRTQGQEAVLVRAFRYDAAGDLVAVRDATGRETRYAYQDHLMVASTNRLGGTHYAQYDKQRRCIARWGSDNAEVRRFAYDEAQQATLVQATDGLQTLYRCEGPLTSMRVGPDGEAQAYYYDERKRLMGFTNEGGDLAALQRFDPEERTLTLAVGNARAWKGKVDERGLMRQVTAGIFGPFELAYSEPGQLTSLTTPSGARWDFARDRRGALSEAASPGGRRVRLMRAANERELKVEDEIGTRFHERYDEAGRLTERRDALDRVQRRQYDPEGRLVVVALDGGYQVRFAYDPSGFLIGVSDTEGYQAALRRDAFGRVLAKSGDGTTWQYQYDRESRLTATSDGARIVRLAYEMGRLAGLTLPDGRHQLVPPEAAGSAADAAAPQFGLAGELRRLGPEDDPVLFTYDAAGHLATVEHAARQLALDCDPDGLPATLQVAPDTNLTFRRDRRGRLVEIAARHTGVVQRSCRFTYDAADRLTSVHTASEQTITLQYDGLDRLVDVRDLNGSQRFGPGGDGVQTHPLLDAEPSVALVTGRHGLAVVVPFGGVQVPLWTQGALPFAPPTAAEVLRRGVAEVLRRGAPRDPLAVLDAWQRRDGFRWLYSEVPAPHELGLPLPVGGWFLQRAFLDSVYPDFWPLTLPVHQRDPRRAPDEVVTGTHRRSALKPFGPLPAASSSIGPPVPEGALHALAALS